MGYYKRKSEVQKIDSGNGHGSWPLLGEEQGCTNECAAGISCYSFTEYTPPAVHEFHEGFMVLSGEGRAKIGEEEFHVDEQTSFFVPKGTEHALKSDSADIPLTVFWFHAKA